MVSPVWLQLDLTLGWTDALLVGSSCLSSSLGNAPRTVGSTRREVKAMIEDSNCKYFEPGLGNLRLPSDYGAILSRQSSMLDDGAN